MVDCGEEVAPVRERGLKYKFTFFIIDTIHCRSREGAWIEMITFVLIISISQSRSREGAWIEISRGEKLS